MVNDRRLKKLKEYIRNVHLPDSLYIKRLAALRVGDLIKAEQLLQQAMNKGVLPNSNPYGLTISISS